jgi:hypothetical protein
MYVVERLHTLAIVCDNDGLFGSPEHVVNAARLAWLKYFTPYFSF